MVKYVHIREGIYHIRYLLFTFVLVPLLVIYRLQRGFAESTQWTVSTSSPRLARPFSLTSSITLSIQLKGDTGQLEQRPTKMLQIKIRILHARFLAMMNILINTVMTSQNPPHSMSSIRHQEYKRAH